MNRGPDKMESTCSTNHLSKTTATNLRGKGGNTRNRSGPPVLLASSIRGATWCYMHLHPWQHSSQQPTTTATASIARLSCSNNYLCNHKRTSKYNKAAPKATPPAYVRAYATNAQQERIQAQQQRQQGSSKFKWRQAPLTHQTHIWSGKVLHFNDITSSLFAIINFHS